MKKPDLEERTKKFSLAVIRLVQTLPRSPEAQILARQLLGSATSVGANYREANRAESRDDFIHKIGIVEKEASETGYWLELLRESRIGDGHALVSLHDESRQLLAIFTTIGKNAKANRRHR